MNLLTDPWVPTDVGVVEPAAALRARALRWPRGDLDAACMVFLVGLVQTAVCHEPKLCENEDDWEELRDEPPDEVVLRSWFGPLAGAFDATRFMQDYDELLDGDVLPVGTLFAENPRDSTIAAKTADLHRWEENVPTAVSLAVACMALFANNLFGVRLGRGHRQGVLGENRMLTLIEPDRRVTMWERVWLNVLPAMRWYELNCDTRWVSKRVFPWLSPTRTSEAGGKTPHTTPSDVDPLQVYWQMPRRYRLADLTEGVCGVTGSPGPVVSEYRRRSDGCNYAGWFHPLAPYRKNKDGTDIPLPLPGPHVGYDHWAGITGVASRNVTPARVVTEHEEQIYRRHSLDEALRLRCFGWHLVGGDVAAWVDQMVPLIVAADRAAFAAMVGDMMNAVVSVDSLLSSTLRRLSGRGDRNLARHATSMLYARTEGGFYEALRQRDASTWPGLLRAEAFRIFDEVTEAMRTDMLAVAFARAKLIRGLIRAAEVAA